MKYMTKEWWETVQKKSQEDREYLKKARGLTLAFQTLVLDAPGGVDRLLGAELERGKIKNATFEEKPAPSDWRTTPADLKKYLMRATGPYETYAAVHKGELPVFQAMTKGFKIEGDMTALMSKIQEYMCFQDLQASFAVEY